ncbi:hypothetical protein [Xenorhabdus bovienii]|uniref:Uncharacterized protein n=3 Tax=Xenorhabdus bovienii TaxID=40576 RepID=A0A0B6X571_XENBV|nr:hypothetical protein [Xenorhabdus bovienii]MCG3469000.1 hypothetical protein [Xenorhabdus bovienii]CDG96565.1 hypothetical protein XBP1_2170030 [Xenorhabdus bovienii str. puntauvense]CDH01118.1 hypothetical protein XBFM1_1980026 [Xenorhabdus bovienii str. feltiae Moldova]CDM88256.1 conserved protein of unknown function [Xenorhabdus bovienii]
MATSSFFRQIVITDPKAIKMLRKANKRKPKENFKKIDIEAEQIEAIEILKRKFSL